MQKIDAQSAEAKPATGENATLAAAAILYFAALVLFSFWFTQS